MALHMHWWIDVVGGWCLGAALAALALRASQIDFVSLWGSKKRS
jgi:membrane-associated phospholipid phosphatase